MSLARQEFSDYAERCGWKPASWVEERELFTRGGATIEVTYAPGGLLREATKREPNGHVDSVDASSGLNYDLLRLWLTGRPAVADEPGTTEDFIREFRLRLVHKHPEWNTVQGTRSRPLTDVGTGTRYATLTSRIPRKELVCVQLCFTKDKDPNFNAARYQALHGVKDQFEAALGAELGEKLVWEGPVGCNTFRLCVKSGLQWVPDKQTWPPVFDWLMDANERFMWAIREVGGLDRL